VALRGVQAAEKRKQGDGRAIFPCFRPSPTSGFLLCALVYFCLKCRELWLSRSSWPTIIKGFWRERHPDRTAWLLCRSCSVPSAWCCSVAIPTGRWSGKGHVAVALLMSAIGIGPVGAGLQSCHHHGVTLLCADRLSSSVAADVSGHLPASFSHRARPAAGRKIAAINSLGNLSGFAGPYAMGLSERSDRQLHSGAVAARGMRRTWCGCCLEPAHRCQGASSRREDVAPGALSPCSSS